MVADRIISTSQWCLFEQQRDKTELRKLFATLFYALLPAEYVVLVVMILLDGATEILIEILDNILQLYIASAFVQTLKTIGVMIAFAFASKEETRIVGLLNKAISSEDQLGAQAQALLL